MEPNSDLGVYEAVRVLDCTSQWIRVLLAEQRLPSSELKQTALALKFGLPQNTEGR